MWTYRQDRLIVWCEANRLSLRCGRCSGPIHRDPYPNEGENVPYYQCSECWATSSVSRFLSRVSDYVPIRGCTRREAYTSVSGWLEQICEAHYEPLTAAVHASAMGDSLYSYLDTDLRWPLTEYRDEHGL